MPVRPRPPRRYEADAGAPARTFDRQRVLFRRTDKTPERTLAMRVLMVVLLLALTVAVLWWDRAGIKDNYDNEVSFTDVMYFTMVTITTVGYGDIVPVSDRARLIDTFFLNPIRVIIWFIFLGTAYQFVVQKMLEDYRMAKIQRRLDGHVIICGYGHTGRSAAREWAAKGHAPDTIVVVEHTQTGAQDAADDGFVALRGDATREEILRQAGVERAHAVIVAPGRDDATILTVLTVRQISPSVRVIASVKEEENAKLVKQSGATVTVAPSKLGGYMLADAIDRAFTVEYLHDPMTAGGQVNLAERAVRPDEVGHRGRMLADGMIMRIQRGREIVGFWDVEATPLTAGDMLLLLVR